MVRKIEAMKMMLLIGNRIVGNIIAYNSSWKDIGQWNSEGKKNVIFVEGRSHSRTDNHNIFYIHFWNFIFEDWIPLQNIQVSFLFTPGAPTILLPSETVVQLGSPSLWWISVLLSLENNSHYLTQSFLVLRQILFYFPMWMLSMVAQV